MARSRGRRRRDGGAYYAVVDEDELERLAGDGGADAIAVLVALRALADAEGVVEGLTFRRMRELTGLGRDGIRSAIDALLNLEMATIENRPGATPSFWLARSAADVIGKATQAANG